MILMLGIKYYVNRGFRVLILIISVSLRKWALRLDSDLAQIFRAVMAKKLRYFLFSLMYIHCLLPNKVSLKAKLECLLTLILNNAPMPGNRWVYFKLIRLCKVDLIVWKWFTIRERVLPIKIPLRLKVSVECPIFVFEISVIFESLTIWIYLRFGQLLCTHNRADHQLLTAWRNNLFGLVIQPLLPVLFNS
jgi:hypothetical protein